MSQSTRYQDKCNSGLPYVIAEIGVNHEGDIWLAKKLIEQAANAGADAVKFQTYKADLLADRDSPAYWDLSAEPTRSQHALFQKYDNFTSSDYAELAEYARNFDVDFLSTPFDKNAVDDLNHLVPIFKVASADITNLQLLRKIAKCRKPVFLSTGASSHNEIRAAVSLLKNENVPLIALLHCILSYPTPDEFASLRMIETLKRTFGGCAIGYSDHTIPSDDMLNLQIAFALGANIIEKHFTHDKTIPGNDHYHAMDENDLRRFIASLDRLTKILGKPYDNRECLDVELNARKHARRSLFFARSLPKGHKISEEDLICKRPGTGISADKIEEVIGKRLASEVTKDLKVKLNHIEDV